MKELQKMIIATVINDHQYQRVSFLEAGDFDNFPGLEFSNYFKVVESSKGDALKIYKRLLLNKALDWLMNEAFYHVAFVNLEKLSIYLVEMRFKKVFSHLLNDLVTQSKSDIERSMIQEYQLELTRTDIFILTDSFLEYLGHHASDYTKSRVEAYLRWREKRVMEIKKHLK